MLIHSPGNLIYTYKTNKWLYEKNYSGKNTELGTNKTMFFSRKIHVAIKHYIQNAYFSSSPKGMTMKGFMTAFFHLLVT